MQKVLCRLVLTLLLLGGSFALTDQPLVVVADSISFISQITDILTAHPLLQSREAQVLDVSLEGEAVLINLSRAILPDSTYNADTFAQLTHALDVEDGQQRIGEWNEWAGQC